jgi:hypothetical protein
VGIRSRLFEHLRLVVRPASARRATFGPEDREVWLELVEQVDAETKKVGSAVVGAWEVGAAELGRAVVGRPDDRALIERYSDALVPTLQPFQDLHKLVDAAMRKGLDAGLAANDVSAATAPLLVMVGGLGQRATDGWAKTVKHLEPVLAACPDPDAARARLADGAPLQRACEDAERVLVAGLAAVRTAPDLWTGLMNAVEAWQLALGRELEIFLCGRAKQLSRDLQGKY